MHGISMITREASREDGSRDDGDEPEHIIAVPMGSGLATLLATKTEERFNSSDATVPAPF